MERTGEIHEVPSLTVLCNDLTQGVARHGGSAQLLSLNRKFMKELTIIRAAYRVLEVKSTWNRVAMILTIIIVGLPAIMTSVIKVIEYFSPTIDSNTDSKIPSTMQLAITTIVCTAIAIAFQLAIEIKKR